MIEIMGRWEVPRGTNKSFFKTRIDYEVIYLSIIKYNKSLINEIMK